MDELNECIKGFFNQGALLRGLMLVGVTYVVLLLIFYIREKRERRTK